MNNLITEIDFIKFHFSELIEKLNLNLTEKSDTKLLFSNSSYSIEFTSNPYYIEPSINFYNKTANKELTITQFMDQCNLNGKKNLLSKNEIAFARTLKNDLKYQLYWFMRIITKHQKELFQIMEIKLNSTLEKDVDSILSKAHNAFITVFINTLKNNNFTDALTYCFPKFDINFNEEKYVFKVTLLFEIDPPRKTGLSDQNQITISDSHKGLTIFEAHATFSKSTNPNIDNWIDKKELNKALNQKLVINNNLENDFLNQLEK